MRVTRQKLVELAKRECLRQAEQSDVVAGYLTGSVAHGEPVLSGTADIDLVLIHAELPGCSREIVPLSEDIHLDIAHHARSFYAQPRQLRVDPWWGPAVAEPLFLYDPSHVFEVAQAGTRGQFYRPDNVHARALAFLHPARLALQAAREDKDWRASYLESLMLAANAAASLAGPPAAGRRAVLTLERRLGALGQAALVGDFAGLLGGPAVFTSLRDWIRGWILAFDALPGDLPPCLHPARRPYLLAGFQAVLDAGRPEAVLWPLLSIWTRSLAALHRLEAVDGYLSPYEAALANCGLDLDSQQIRCTQLERYLDRVEELLEDWALRSGV